MKSIETQNKIIKRGLQAVVIGGAILLLFSASTVPFLFESPSLYYKLGMDKLLLRTGKVLGLLTAVLILYQTLPVSRFIFLEKLFTRRTLYTVHRTGGKLILLMAILHAACILAAENFTFFPLEKRYWPEFTGMAVLLLIGITVAAAVWQKQLKLQRPLWQKTHRWAATLITGLMVVHILFVSESFSRGIPRSVLLAAAGGAVIVFGRLYYRSFSDR